MPVQKDRSLFSLQRAAQCHVSWRASIGRANADEQSSMRTYHRDVLMLSRAFIRLSCSRCLSKCVGTCAWQKHKRRVGLMGGGRDDATLLIGTGCNTAVDRRVRPLVRLRSVVRLRNPCFVAQRKVGSAAGREAWGKACDAPRGVRASSPKASQVLPAEEPIAAAAHLF